MHNKKTILKKQFFLILYMYLGYAGFIFMKTSILVISPDLVADNLITITQWGIILGWGALGAIIGKILSGAVADRFGGKWTFTIGILLTAISVVLFGMSSIFFAFNLIYFSALFAKSSGWPSIAKLIGNWYSPSQYGLIWGILSTSSRVGAIIALSSLGYLLYILTWRQVLWFAFLIGIVLFGISFFFIKEKPSTLIKVNGSCPVEHTNHHLHDTSLKQALLVFITNKRVWLISVSMMGLTIMMDILNFLPIYLSQNLKISTVNAATFSTAFPVGSLISVLLGGYFIDKISSKSVTKLVGLSLTLAVVSLVVLIIMPEFGLSASGNKYVTVGALFIFGFMVSPSYYLPMSIFSIKFGGPHSGILIALLDVVGFVATMIFSFIGGALIDQNYGWVKFFILLITISIISLLVTVWFLHGEAKVTENKQ